MEKKVKLKLYGPLREKAGDSLILTLKNDPVVADLLREIAEKLKLTEEQKNSLRIANEKGFLQPEEKIKEEVLYVIPPVGGG